MTNTQNTPKVATWNGHGWQMPVIARARIKEGVRPRWNGRPVDVVGINYEWVTILPGDFIIIRIDDIPDDVEKFEAENGHYVIAHSETGHNHVMVMDRVEAFKPKHTQDRDLYELFLNVKEPTDIVHLRSFDTHETLRVPAGKYQIRRQREYVPEGFRRAAD
jgi:hypothetical protein